MRIRTLPLIGAVFLVAVIALLFAYFQTPESEEIVTNSLRLRDSYQARDPQDTEGLGGRASPIERQEVVADVMPFLDRWRALLEDSELRARLAVAGEMHLKKLVMENGPFPFTPALQELNNHGCVPPPRIDEMLELQWSTMVNASNLLQRQADSLTSHGGTLREQVSPRERDEIMSGPLEYAPEVIGTLLVRGPLQQELASNHPLRAALQEVRTSAIVAYCLAWDDFQFAKHCAIRAARESNIELPSLDWNGFLSRLNPEFAELQAKTTGVQSAYLQGILNAVRLYYPEAQF